MVESFIELFGQYKVVSLVSLITAFVFLYNIYSKVIELIIKKHEEQRKKDEILKETHNLVKEYPNIIDELAKTSEGLEELKKQQEFQSKKLEEINLKQDNQSKKLEEINNRELNTLRDRLLQSYRYYTSLDKNPTQTWTTTESSTFWKMFGDYEDLGGNGHFHTEVKPAMNKLQVIDNKDIEKVKELFSHRR